MKELNDLFQNLYRNFILRDLLSFIIPGAIIVIPLFSPYVEPYIKPYLGHNNSLSFPEGAALATLLFGLFYIVGFTVQCLGAEVLKILLFYNEGKFSPAANQTTFEVYYTNTIKIGESNYDAIKSRFERFVALKQMCGNCSLALLISGVYLQIYYLCGSLYLLFSVVIVISYCTIACSFLCSGEKPNENNTNEWVLLFLLVTIILAICSICSICSAQYVTLNKFVALLSVSMQIASPILLFAHYVHVKRQDTYMLTAIEYMKNNPKPSPTSTSSSPPTPGS